MDSAAKGPMHEAQKHQNRLYTDHNVTLPLSLLRSDLILNLDLAAHLTRHYLEHNNRE